MMSRGGSSQRFPPFFVPHLSFFRPSQLSRPGLPLNILTAFQPGIEPSHEGWIVFHTLNVAEQTDCAEARFRLNEVRE